MMSSFLAMFNLLFGVRHLRLVGQVDGQRHVVNAGLFQVPMEQDGVAVGCQGQPLGVAEVGDEGAGGCVAAVCVDDDGGDVVSVRT